MTFTHDNRWQTGHLHTLVPDTAVAAYGARWIDQGDYMLPDIVLDRQGFAYNKARDRGALRDAMVDTDLHGRVALVYTRDIPILVASQGSFTAWVRRAGGYYYVVAWLDKETP